MMGPNLRPAIVAVRLVVFFLAAFLLVPGMPVNFFSITRGDETLLAAPLTNGAAFVTSYIHSVQLTPVIDDYRITGGEIWGWEERVQSQNAGLPFAAPEHGAFIMAPPWMIVRGGRRAQREIVHRVGTDKLGRNLWRLPPFAEIKAYEKYPSARVIFSASVRRLRDAPVVSPH